jgi:hypothetical protein
VFYLPQRTLRLLQKSVRNPPDSLFKLSPGWISFAIRSSIAANPK